MKVLVTGCSGGVGEKVLDFFIKNKIYSYANFNKKKLNKKESKFLIPYKQNINGKEFKIPRDVDSLVHIASLTKNQKKLSTYKVNIRMSKNILKVVKRNTNLKIAKIIFV